MKVPVSWLKTLVPVKLSAVEIAGLLNKHALEVEGLEDPGASISQVIIAQIKEYHKHPNADKLNICQMDTGKEILQVVCGAGNVKQGMKTALALVGAQLPGGMEIKKAKLRGELSEGMNCSLRELGLSTEAAGIIELPADAPLGKDIKDYLDFEAVLEVAMLPNRGDAQSMIGIATEIAAITGTELLKPGYAAVKFGSKKLEIKIDSPDCYRYLGARLEGLKIAPSPEWLQRRLQKAGLNPINNLVDITNYLLWETGQPLHVFDAAKVDKILVRQAKPGEKIKILDGTERELLADDLVITDGRQPIAIAGIMGGAESGVVDSTTSVILEAAVFDSVRIHKTSRRMALRSESSQRFEKGVDYDNAEDTYYRALNMILDLAGGQVTSLKTDVRQREIVPVVIDFRPAQIEKVLGLAIPDADKILQRLGLKVTKSSAQLWQVTVPSGRRQDVYREIDLIEEVGRINGYDKIPFQVPQQMIVNYQSHNRFKLRQQIRNYLVAAGFNEAVTYPMINHSWQVSEALEIVNPISEEEAVLRERLLPSLLLSLKNNLALKEENVALFETGYEYRQINKQALEIEKTAAILYGSVKQGEFGSQEKMDFYYIKNILQGLFNYLGVTQLKLEKLSNDEMFHPGRSASYGKLACFGESHPLLQKKLDLNQPVYMLEIDLTELEKCLTVRKALKNEIPKFPGSVQDIAFMLETSVSIQQIEQVFAGIKAEIIESFALIDCYEGDKLPTGHRSLTYRIQYRHPQRTLTEQEVLVEHKKIADKLAQELPLKFR